MTKNINTVYSEHDRNEAYKQGMLTGVFFGLVLGITLALLSFIIIVL
jgi:tetrahydromethanopterin S-methyltransferase subunit B